MSVSPSASLSSLGLSSPGPLTTALPLSLDPGSATPAYLQLAQGLQGLILAGALPGGAALPGERELAASLGVSRVTVRQALRVLQERGLLHRRQGSGTFVREGGPAAQSIVQPLSALTGFSEDMRSRGRTPGSLVLSFERGRPTPQEAMTLAVSPRSEVVRLRRLRSADGEPLAVETSSLPARVLPGVSLPDVEGGSLYTLLRERGFAPARAMQHLRASEADDDTARWLDLRPGAALLATERVTWDAAGSVLEYARAAYRGDRYDFVVELQQ